MVKDKILSLDIFIHISSFLVGFSHEETKNLFYKHREVISKKLFDLEINRTEEKFKKPMNPWYLNISVFAPKKEKMTKEEYIEEQKQATVRYRNRITF